MTRQIRGYDQVAVQIQLLDFHDSIIGLLGMVSDANWY
jgi:hypothetical protein